ncbi:MAG: hypothetical protein AAB372_02975 [Patescibacteria group bacterium]
MNLLPDSYKKELRYEAWRRYVVTFGLYFGVVALAGDLLLLPSFFALTFRFDAKQDYLSSIQKSQEFKELDETGKRLGKVNTLLRNVAGYGKDTLPVMRSLEEIINKVGSDIHLTSIELDRAQVDGKPGGVIKLSGIANTRSSFLSFFDALKAHPKVKSYDSPVTNILKEQNADFNLTLRIQL